MMETTTIKKAKELRYSPPYERPAHDEMAHHLAEYLSGHAEIDYQVMHGDGATTFVVTMPFGARVGIEIGDEPYTDRDRTLVHGGFVGTLYRFSAEDAYDVPRRCLTFIAEHDPYLFGVEGTTRVRFQLTGRPITATRHTLTVMTTEA